MRKRNDGLENYLKFPFMNGEQEEKTMKKIMLILLILPGLIWAQYNNKEILLNQANRYLMQRNYEKANQLYEQVLTDYPVDGNTVELYINNLIRISKIDKAAEKLQLYADNLPEFIFVRLNTAVLISQGKPDQAYDETRKFLEQHPGSIQYYKSLAAVFEQFRQPETAISILLQARKVAKDDYLYALELATDYESIKEYKNAVNEFMKLAERQQAYSNYVLNHLKQMLQDDQNLIKEIEKSSGKYEQENIIRIVAQCYAAIDDYDNALAKYEKLSPEILASFAGGMQATGNLPVAERAFLRYLERETDVTKKTDASIDLAEILISREKLSEAEKILLGLYNDQDLKSQKYRYRTKANSECRLMLAEITLRQNDNDPKVLAYLEEAKQFAFNQAHQNEIEYKIIHYEMLIGKFTESQNRLSRLLEQEEPGSDSYKLGYYYAYFLAMMQNDSAADSLLGEVIINLPEDEKTNDALLVFVITSFLEDEQKAEFFAAYRQMQLHKSEAAEQLMALYHETKNEELLILAGDWALLNNDPETAGNIFSSEIKNPVLKEYAQLQLAKLSPHEELCKTFLTDHPRSVFSPEFREIMGNK